jgi:Leucine-rich repeat (LRR) protein
MTKLERLSLSGTRVTNKGLKDLAGLTELKKLSVANTKITEAGLTHLEGMKSLRELNVFGSPNVSKKAAEALQKKLPDLKIDGAK